MRARARRTSYALALLPLALPIIACGADDTLGGFGLPQLDAADRAEVLTDAGASTGPVEGTLSILDDGCHTFSGTGPADGAWIVWPSGTAPVDGDKGQVRLVDGTTAVDGSALVGAGAVVTLADLPGGENQDSYFASFGTFCGADQRGVLVLEDAASGA